MIHHLWRQNRETFLLKTSHRQRQPCSSRLNWRCLIAVASDKRAVQRPHPLDQQQPAAEARAAQAGLAGQMRSGVMTGKRAGEGMPARLDQRGGKRRNRQRKPDSGPG